MMCPCKDCEKRHPHCHAECKEYIAFSKYRTDLNQTIRDEKQHFSRYAEKPSLKKYKRRISKK